MVQDEILTPWESVLDFDSYAVRVPRSQIHRIPEILRDISPRRVASMQAALGKVWERFTFSSLALAERDRLCAHAPHAEGCREMRRQLGGAGGAVSGRDALDTLMHVLYARLLAKKDLKKADARRIAARR